MENVSVSFTINCAMNTTQEYIRDLGIESGWEETVAVLQIMICNLQITTLSSVTAFL